MSVKFLKFEASWCVPCSQLTDLMNTLDLSDYDIYYIDIDTKKDLKEQYNIRSIPTLVKLVDDVEVARNSGMMTRSKLENFLKL